MYGCYLNESTEKEFCPHSLDFEVDARLIRETYGGLARWDVELKMEDGEWVRIGDLIDSN